MGKRERRSYIAEFKREAVELARQSSGSVSGVAQQLGIASSSLTRWVREAKNAEYRSGEFAERPPDIAVASTTPPSQPDFCLLFVREAGSA